jgi:hypothetical protein
MTKDEAMKDEATCFFTCASHDEGRTPELLNS